jgi:hypothetical protein
MRTMVRMLSLFLVLGTIAMCVLGLWLRPHRVSLLVEATRAVAGSVEDSRPTVSQDNLLANPGGPKLAVSTDPKRDKGSWAKRQEARAKERAIMAKTWGLSKYQALRFDWASNVALEERMLVVERYNRGEISSEQMFAELPAANKKGDDSLREAIGEERFEEYKAMEGHFAEAGLEHKAFEPAVIAFAGEPPAE